jgi:hypothetical protein
LLDEQAVKYALANKKWKARITSKNPSLAIEEDGKKEEFGVTHEFALSPFSTQPPHLSFTCTSCCDCRYGDLPMNQEIVPSVPNPPSTQPFVVLLNVDDSHFAWRE